MVDLNILVATIGAIGCVLTFLVLHSRTPDALRARIKDKDEQIKDLASKLNSIRGKYVRLAKGVQFHQGTKPPQTLDDAKNMIPNMIDAFMPHIPKKYRPLAQNQQVRDIINKIAGKAMDEHPNEAVEFTAAFVPPVAKELVKMAGSESNSSNSYL